LRQDGIRRSRGYNTGQLNWSSGNNFYRSIAQLFQTPLQKN
jgi:hypothetical protein